MAKFIATAKRFAADESCANLVEYGLLIGLIALLCVSAVGVIGQSVKALFNFPSF
jgi:pilus assembly protein Flp/PilA